MIAVGLAFLFGASAAFVFLTVNNPETVPTEVTNRFGWSVLAPTTFLLCLCSRSRFWLCMLTMIAGIFIGVCIRCVLPPVQSNLWPIAAAIWTALFLLPIVAGAVAGGVGHWIIKKVSQ